jgi:hypothetical protein
MLDFSLEGVILGVVPITAEGERTTVDVFFH